MSFIAHFIVSFITHIIVSFITHIIVSFIAHFIVISMRVHHLLIQQQAISSSNSPIAYPYII